MKLISAQLTGLVMSSRQDTINAASNGIYFTPQPQCYRRLKTLDSFLGKNRDHKRSCGVNLLLSRFQWTTNGTEVDGSFYSVRAKIDDPINYCPGMTVK